MKKSKHSKGKHDWSHLHGKVAYGWLNLSTGSICQNVVADSPAALFERAGLKVDDPEQPYLGFRAVAVTVDDANVLTEDYLPAIPPAIPFTTLPKRYLW